MIFSQFGNTKLDGDLSSAPIADAGVFDPLEDPQREQKKLWNEVLSLS